jgi:hypothetical protein
LRAESVIVKYPLNADSLGSCGSTSAVSTSESSVTTGVPGVTGGGGPASLTHLLSQATTPPQRPRN